MEEFRQKKAFTIIQKNEGFPQILRFLYDSVISFSIKSFTSPAYKNMGTFTTPTISRRDLCCRFRLKL